MSIFVDRLSQLMDATKTTQTDLARVVGMRRQSIAQYLNGISQPTLETLIKMAQYFQVSVDYLTGNSSVMSQDADVARICKETGLSEIAFGVLSSDPDKQRIVNYLLERGKDFFKYAARYHVATSKPQLKRYETMTAADLFEAIKGALRFHNGDEMSPEEMQTAKVFMMLSGLGAVELQLAYERVVELKQESDEDAP